jgi:hypothetical protein
MSSLTRLWDECRTLQMYLVGTALVAAWTAFGMQVHDGVWARVFRNLWAIWEIYVLRSDFWCRYVSCSPSTIGGDAASEEMSWVR